MSCVECSVCVCCLSVSIGRLIIGIGCLLCISSLVI